MRTSSRYAEESGVADLTGRSDLNGPWAHFRERTTAVRVALEHHGHELLVSEKAM
jgi:hypothetical protein